MSKIRFEVASSDKIAEFIFDLKDSLKEEALKQRSGSSCIFVQIEPEIKTELLNAERLTVELKEKLKKIAEKKLNEKEKELKDFKKEVEDYWREIEENYFEEIQKNIPISLEKEYICYINNCVVSSYFNNNEISLTYFEEFSRLLKKEEKKKLLSEISFIIAEEVLHLIYFKYWKKIFNLNLTYDKIFDIGTDDYSAWHIAEIIPEFLLVQNSHFKKFGWGGIDRSKRGYFWIPKIKEKLGPLWKSKKNFKDFLIKAHRGIV